MQTLHTNWAELVRIPGMTLKQCNWYNPNIEIKPARMLIKFIHIDMKNKEKQSKKQTFTLFIF